MKRFTILVVVVCFLQFHVESQTLALTFTGIDSLSSVKLEKINVINQTRGVDTTLYWPDTILVLDYQTGVEENEIEGNGFQVFQNYPNPVSEQTIISIYIPEQDNVNIFVSDILGRIVLRYDRVMGVGIHSLRLYPGRGNLFFFTAHWKGKSYSIKILKPLFGKHLESKLEYIDRKVSNNDLKNNKTKQKFAFISGDEMLYIGHANGLQSGMLDTPEESHIYRLQFIYNIPCLYTPTVYYHDQTYNTVQIFNQCWMKENLNVGKVIYGSADMKNNGIIEKYSSEYGGLYQWNEMMQYSTHQGTRGICPVGWHIPTENEWKLLEGLVDSQYGISDPEWDISSDWRGYDIATNLKNESGWDNDGNGSDLFGFSGLPGGNRTISGENHGRGSYGMWWSSSDINNNEANYRLLRYDFSEIYLGNRPKEYGFTVRCIKDLITYDQYNQLSFTGTDDTAYIQLDSIKILNKTNERVKILYYPDTILRPEIDLPNYQPGDELLLIGFYDIYQSGILDSPESGKDYTFQFARNIPCPETPIVEYEGQVYNTIQIFSQCWLKENLNVGLLIPSDQSMEYNNTIEKYCYNNEPDSCEKYGGLYQFGEMMQYIWQQGEQGICPPGWHLPTDEEWSILEGAADSQYGIGDSEWEIEGPRGTDVGGNLRTTSGWLGSGNGTDLFDFSGLPGGSVGSSNNFSGIGGGAAWWTSSVVNGEKVNRSLYQGNTMSRRNYTDKKLSKSVRCLRDY